MPLTCRLFCSSCDSPSFTCASQGSVCDLNLLPEVTELDRILVRVTAAALGASVNSQDIQQHPQRQPDLNSNNDAGGISEALNFPTLSTKKPKSLALWFRSLFGIKAPKPSKVPEESEDDECGQSFEQQKSGRDSRVAQHRELEELRQQLLLQHQHRSYPLDPLEQSTEANVQMEAAGLSAGSHKGNIMTAAQNSSEDAMANNSQYKLRGICGGGTSSGGGGGCDVTPQPELVNISNTSTPKRVKTHKKLKKENKLKKTKNSKQKPQQQQLPEQTQQHMQEQQSSQQPTSAESPMQSEAQLPQPQNNADDGHIENEPVSAYSPPSKIHVFRGGPTTTEHKRLRDTIFRECRIIPVSTLYKKVAMVPGRERLLLTAPSNPRAMASPLLYDIAYENHRHHSDCNRDFVRVGLKKICSNYCRPSQFRYVY